MSGFLKSAVANTNEEYKKVIKRRMNNLIAVAFIGIVTIALAIFSEVNRWTVIKEDMFRYYMSFGAGLLGCAVALLLKNNRLLGDEEKLRRSRIANADERIREISSRAYRMATVILLVVMYIVALIGGIFVPILAKLLMGLIGLFVLAYLVGYKLIEKNM